MCFQTTGYFDLWPPGPQSDSTWPIIHPFGVVPPPPPSLPQRERDKKTVSSPTTMELRKNRATSHLVTCTTSTSEGQLLAAAACWRFDISSLSLVKQPETCYFFPRIQTQTRRSFSSGREGYNANLPGMSIFTWILLYLLFYCIPDYMCNCV